MACLWLLTHLGDVQSLAVPSHGDDSKSHDTNPFGSAPATTAATTDTTSTSHAPVTSAATGGTSKETNSAPATVAISDHNPFGSTSASSDSVIGAVANNNNNESKVNASASKDGNNTNNESADGGQRRSRLMEAIEGGEEVSAELLFRAVITFVP
jgi:hypothetical protein